MGSTSEPQSTHIPTTVENPIDKTPIREIGGAESSQQIQNLKRRGNPDNKVVEELGHLSTASATDNTCHTHSNIRSNKSDSLKRSVIPSTTSTTTQTRVSPPSADDLHKFTMNVRYRISILLVLYFIQAIPMGVTAALPLILQGRGATYSQIAVMTVASLPFSLKLLWAPLVDATRFKSLNLGRRKSWLIPCQVFVSLIMMISAVFKLPSRWAGEYNAYPINVTALASFLFLQYLLMATQDIVVDGWALEMLPPTMRKYASTCNSVGQNVGYYSTNIVFLLLNHSPEVDGARPYSFMNFSLSLNQVMWWGGVFILIVTVFVACFVTESPLQDIGDDVGPMDSVVVMVEEQEMHLILDHENNLEEHVHGLSMQKKLGNSNSSSFISAADDLDVVGDETLLYSKQHQQQDHPGDEGVCSRTATLAETIRGYDESVQPHIQKENPSTSNSLYLPSTTAQIQTSDGEEANAAPDSILDSYTMLFFIAKLKPVIVTSALLLLVKIPFATYDGAAQLKIVESGLPRELFALLSPILFPVGVATSYFASRWINPKRSSLIVYAYGYIGRMVMTVVMSVFLVIINSEYIADMIRGSQVTTVDNNTGLVSIARNPDTVYRPAKLIVSSVVVLMSSLSVVFQETMFVSQMAFFAQVSDPAMGGTYMTFFNTMSNLGSKWPVVVSLFLLDRSAHTMGLSLWGSLTDGFVVLNVFGIVTTIGVIILVTKPLKQYFASLSPKEWSVSRSSQPLGLIHTA